MALFGFKGFSLVQNTANTHTDESFHNFRSSRSEVYVQERRAADFEAPKIVKGFVGPFWEMVFILFHNVLLRSRGH